MTAPRRAAALALALAAASPAEGQRVPPRAGGWAEIAAGTGGVWVTCTDCGELAPSFGRFVHARAGGAYTRKVLLGVEVLWLLTPEGYGSSPADSVVVTRAAAVSPSVLWYPLSGRAYVKGGASFVLHGMRLTRRDGTFQQSALREGSGMTFGLGLDVPLTPRLAVSVGADAHYGAVGDFSVEGRYLDDVIASMYVAHLALVLR